MPAGRKRVWGTQTTELYLIEIAGAYTAHVDGNMVSSAAQWEDIAARVNTHTKEQLNVLKAKAAVKTRCS